MLPRPPTHNLPLFFQSLKPEEVKRYAEKAQDKCEHEEIGRIFNEFPSVLSPEITRLLAKNLQKILTEVKIDEDKVGVEDSYTVARMELWYTQVIAAARAEYFNAQGELKEEIIQILGLEQYRKLLKEGAAGVLGSFIENIQSVFAKQLEVQGKLALVKKLGQTDSRVQPYFSAIGFPPDDPRAENKKTIDAYGKKNSDYFYEAQFLVLPRAKQDYFDLEQLDDQKKPINYNQYIKEKIFDKKSPGMLGRIFDRVKLQEHLKYRLANLALAYEGEEEKIDFDSIARALDEHRDESPFDDAGNLKPWLPFSDKTREKFSQYVRKLNQLQTVLLQNQQGQLHPWVIELLGQDNINKLAAQFGIAAVQSQLRAAIGIVMGSELGLPGDIKAVTPMFINQQGTINGAFVDLAHRVLPPSFVGFIFPESIVPFISALQGQRNRLVRNAFVDTGKFLPWLEHYSKQTALFDLIKKVNELHCDEESKKRILNQIDDRLIAFFGKKPLEWDALQEEFSLLTGEFDKVIGLFKELNDLKNSIGDRDDEMAKAALVVYEEGMDEAHKQVETLFKTNEIEDQKKVVEATWCARQVLENPGNAAFASDLYNRIPDMPGQPDKPSRLKSAFMLFMGAAMLAVSIAFAVATFGFGIPITIAGVTIGAKIIVGAIVGGALMTASSAVKVYRAREKGLAKSLRGLHSQTTSIFDEEREKEIYRIPAEFDMKQIESIHEHFSAFATQKYHDYECTPQTIQFGFKLELTKGKEKTTLLFDKENGDIIFNEELTDIAIRAIVDSALAGNLAEINLTELTKDEKKRFEKVANKIFKEDAYKDKFHPTLIFYPPQLSLSLN